LDPIQSGWYLAGTLIDSWQRLYIHHSPYDSTKTMTTPRRVPEAEHIPEDGLPTLSFFGMKAIIASARMRALLQFVERIARTNAAVLITGESGTGKELIARALHHFSSRAAKPFIDINCAALPDHLLESELFGYERGAFSGAESSKEGMFELAHRGTLLLDEIGELSAGSQSKLLRVLDGFPHYRLGGTRKIEVDARVVAATNADLEGEVRERRFRADLFHRLNQVRVEVPPLRDRVEDIRPLMRFFLSQVNPALTVSPDAVAALEMYSWPGNVRELKNLAGRLGLTAAGTEIRLQDLPAAYRAASSPAARAHGCRIAEAEQGLILRALEQAEGRRNRAAELLGISRRTLIRRLKSYGVTSTRSGECSAAPARPQEYN
jgi:two-component system, NtrC family, response regulator AtoC